MAPPTFDNVTVVSCEVYLKDGRMFAISLPIDADLVVSTFLSGASEEIIRLKTKDRDGLTSKGNSKVLMGRPVGGFLRSEVIAVVPTQVEFGPDGRDRAEEIGHA